uniref:Photosystem II extrinsic protein V n=1 Tax=Batrachospermum sp. TaxID=31373 RepID=A0A8K1YUX5_9FLOR|nr:photosystem II cytochrome c550 [Batrachospermum sp.]
MPKKFRYIPYIISLLISIAFHNNAYAIELDQSTLTVPLNSSGKTIILTPEQVKRGKRLFNNTCSQCHNGGITKTNPNIGLDPEGLSLATPPRDNIESLIDYMKNPTSYDGAESIAELHPSIKSAEIFPKMRNLTDDDLLTIAGHILVQPKVVLEKWGGGKIYY